MDRDNSNAVAPKSDESTKQEDTPLPTIPSLTITEEYKILPLEKDQSEPATDRKLNNVHFQPEVQLKDNHPGVLKTDSSASEVMLKTIPNKSKWNKEDELSFISNKNSEAK